MTTPGPEGGPLAKFFAKKVVQGNNQNTKVPAVNEVELAERTNEIVIETQTAGSSYLKAHIIDPELALAVSGWLDVKEGLLEPIEIEFPENSKWFWVLCAVEGSTDVSSANLIITLEDRIVYYMRQYFGKKTAPPGIQTRAQFIRGLVTEIGSRGEPKAGFICPSLNVVQEVETEAQAESKKTHTALDKQEKEELQQKRGGLGTGSITIEGVPATRQQAADVSTAIQTANRLKAGTIEVESLIAAGIAESGFKREASEKNEPNNPHKGIWQSDIIPPNEVAKQAEHFLIGGESFKAGGAKGRVLAGVKNPAQIGVEVEIGGSQARMEQVLPEARKIISESGGLTANTAGSTEESVSDVGQLERGTNGNPDEDSFECAVRLASQVNWFFFSDNRKFFFMDGPDLMKQKPSLYIDVPKNHIKYPDGSEHWGAIHAPTTFHQDNTTFEYRRSHKVKKRLERKAKSIKPASPAEIKLLLECDITQFHAGEAFRFVNSGPMNGQWIITNTRRECLKDIYTEIILEPPVEPLPEPRATGGTEELEGGNPTGTAPSGSALAAFDAASTLSSMQLPYPPNDAPPNGHESGKIANTSAASLGPLDCSASTCWVLHQAHMFPSTTAVVSGELESFGEAGPGKEMTIWARADHVFIEFNIPGHETAQCNTNGPENGPRLYTISKNPTHNVSPASENYVPRHFKGT